jgi:hypothetical protein
VTRSARGCSRSRASSFWTALPRCARLLMRRRVFRTATRNFDLELAIATLRLHTQLYVEIERFR